MKMKLAKLLILLLVFIFDLKEICGHGRLMEPINRSSMWRKGYNTPINWNDNQNFCGGFSAQYANNDGKCGVCGDDYSEQRPRDNENKGIYGTGIIVKTYKAGETIHMVAEVTANHKGHFEFQLCPLNDSEEMEEEECFEKYPLPLVDGSYEYKLPTEDVGFFETDIVLPEGISCDHCVLRWEYITGNNWGTCKDGSQALGCGPQETFKSCSDIAIR